MVAFSMSPLNFNYDKAVNLENAYVSEVESLNELYKDKVDKDEEEANKYLKEYRTISENYIYEHNRLSIFENVVLVILTLLYFALVPYFMDGQTLGKRIMKIRVMNLEDKKPSLLSFILRAIILYGIAFNILVILCLAVLDKSSFFAVYTVLSYLSYGLNLAILFTMLVREDKRGLHDLIAKTKVERI